MGYGIPTNIVGYRIPGRYDCVKGREIALLGYENIHWDTGYHALKNEYPPLPDEMVARSEELRTAVSTIFVTLYTYLGYTHVLLQMKICFGGLGRGPPDYNLQRAFLDLMHTKVHKVEFSRAGVKILKWISIFVKEHVAYV